MAQRYVKIFFGWPEETKELTSEEKGRLIDAVVMYARGEPVDLKGNEKFLFPVFKAQIDRDSETYDTIVARNQANGSKGGRPKKNPENPVGFSETQPNPENPVGFSETEKSQDKGRRQKAEGKRQKAKSEGCIDDDASASPQKRFAPPSQDEVTTFMLEYTSGKLLRINVAREAEMFLNFYEANGWKSGRTPLKDWKAAARNWCLRATPIAQPAPRPPAPASPPANYRSLDDLYSN